MQFKLTAEQAQYLAHYIDQLATIANRTPGAAKQARTAQKMRYKFSGTPTTVFLGGRERALIVEMLTYRAINMTADASGEAALLHGILEVI